ncbi:MAG: PepSY domain-containing protein [Proteobacteria bacterium]|nr:PepSY domain-containing protein [Pseudomonadota bacterium]
MARSRLLLVLLGAVLLPLSAAAAGLSMDQAVKAAEQRYHARVVKAEPQNDGGRTVYVLRLLNESGKVWTVRVDAASGAMQ